jgi:hypothetical protein
MRAKIQGGELIYPPYTCVRPDGSTVVGYPQREDLLAADGWKVVEDVVQPKGLWSGSWADVGGVIRRVWTPREKTALEQAQADAQEAKEAKLTGLRSKYRKATRALCREAGIVETDALTAEQLEGALLTLLEDADTGAKVKRNVKALGFSLQLEFLTRLLEREDGDDALDRV